MRRHIGGHCQRSVSRCLRAHGEATTAMIVAWCYRQPAETRRQRQCRAQAVRYAASRIAVTVGRVWPHGNVWRMARK
jgi:hypothetical protein